MSRLRYGLQLYSKAVLNSEDVTSSTLKSLQITQNRMLRCLNRSRISDKISVTSMLEKFGLLSVNQLAVQIKLIEVWKSVNMPGHPLRLEAYNAHNSDLKQALRARPNRVYNDSAKYCISKSSFHIDAARIWNQAPASVTTAKSIVELKRKSSLYVRSLPS